MNICKFKKGTKIHIKEKNKGSFTKWCGGNVTDECILKGKNSSNPKIRKKATFAANSRKWKHEDVLKGLGGLVFPKSTAYSEIPKKSKNEISYPEFSLLISLPLSARRNAATMNKFNRFKSESNRVESGITRAFDNAKKQLGSWYQSDDYNRRLNQARENSWFPFFLLSNELIVSNLNNRLNNVSLDFDNGNRTDTNSVNGKYLAVTVPGENKIYFNKDSYKYLTFPGNIFGTSAHELSHYSDKALPKFVRDYNHSLIKLNPNLSKEVKDYYGDDSEIRARAVDIITNFNQSGNKSLDDFVNKNTNVMPAVKQLLNTFDSRESMMNYLNNFAYNDTSESNGSFYAKNGGIL